LLALLGIAQRQIKAERCPDRGITRDRKGKSRVPKSLGDWVRLWRLNKGLTQRQLAQIARLPCRRIHVIETDLVVPAMNEIVAIERATGVDAAILTGRGQQ
jgi:ribosome-binding protein aMBF1 (putative translation factor)